MGCTVAPCRGILLLGQVPNTMLANISTIWIVKCLVLDVGNLEQLHMMMLLIYVVMKAHAPCLMWPFLCRWQ